MTTQSETTSITPATTCASAFTEQQLWEMLDEGGPRARKAFVIIMVRIHNDADFEETNPLQRGYDWLYELGDGASLYLMRHFLQTVRVVAPDEVGELMEDLLAPRPFVPTPLPETAAMNVQPTPTPREEPKPQAQVARPLSQKKRRKEEAAKPQATAKKKAVRKSPPTDAGFGASKTPAFVAASVPAE